MNSIARIFTMLVFCLAARVSAAETLESVEKKLDGMSDKITSMTCKQKTVMDMEMGPTKMTSDTTGTYEYVKKGDKMMWRMESKGVSVTKMAGMDNKTETTGLMIGDGEYNWTLSETNGQKACYKQRSPRDNQTTAGKTFFASMREDHTLKLLPDETIDGKPCWVVEATPKEKPSTPDLSMGVTIFFIQQDTGLIVKTVTKDGSGKPISTMTMTDIKINPSINPDRFKFKAPAGVEVMDMSAVQEGAAKGG